MTSPTASSSVPPRVVIVMPDQWRRALLRAALREEGYDAIGARELRGAHLVRPVVPDRGPVRLLIVDQDVLRNEFDASSLGALRERHNDPVTILLARATLPPREGSWDRVLRRPVSVGDIVNATEALLPLPPELHRAID